MVHFFCEQPTYGGWSTSYVISTQLHACIKNQHVSTLRRWFGSCLGLCIATDLPTHARVRVWRSGLSSRARNIFKKHIRWWKIECHVGIHWTPRQMMSDENGENCYGRSNRHFELSAIFGGPNLSPRDMLNFLMLANMWTSAYEQDICWFGWRFTLFHYKWNLLEWCL